MVKVKFDYAHFVKIREMEILNQVFFHLHYLYACFRPGSQVTAKCPLVFLMG